MATYSKTTWATGDLITAEKMNKIETQLETTTPGATGSVRFDTSSSLTDAQKTQARTNIDVLSTTETNNKLAAAYNSVTNYAIGDYCMYNNKLYRCIAAATNILPTNTTYWVEENTVSGALKSLDAEKADIDGYYTGLTAGNAEQLVSSVKEKDTTPYVYRTTGGDVDVGNRREIELVGGSIAWNQLVYSLNTTSEIYGITRTATADNKGLVVSGTSSNSTNFTVGAMKSGEQTIAGHKYLFTLGTSNSLPSGVFVNVGSEQRKYSTIITYSADYTTSIGIYISSGTAINVTVYPQIFDLTQMFGSTIADYVYSLETATAGAGVAWFKALFPKDYYAYNAGELMSVQAARAETVGFNLWDGVAFDGKAMGSTGTVYNDATCFTTDYIRVIPGQKYYLDQNNWKYWVDIYDSQQSFVQLFSLINGVLTVPESGFYIRATGLLANKAKCCINLSWSGYRNGEYEPYVKNTYNFDSSLELRGIPKLSEDGKLYYDGDTYKSDGSVTRKYGIVDLGTLNWNYEETYNRHGFALSALPYAAKIPSASNAPNAVCSKYMVVSSQSGWSNRQTVTCLAFDSTYGRVYNDGTADAAAFKAAMSGVYLVYELATPTEESTSTFASPQVIDDFGTEEFIDAAVEAETRDVAIPVGHNTAYTANLRDKLQHLPDSTSEDGVYVIKQENKQMELQKFEGHYENVSVDSANQLISSLYEEDKVPYSFRTSGGSADIGDRVKEKIIGGTVAWNQIASKKNYTSEIADTRVVFQPRIQNTSGSGEIAPFGIELTSTGIKATIFSSIFSGLFKSKHNGSSVDIIFFYSTVPLVQGHKYLMTANFTGVDPTTVGGIAFDNMMIIDLTQMFGSAIADYVYSLEQATAGAGVAWFKSLFPLDYYEYNAGELMSVQAARKETVGFNLLDINRQASSISSASPNAPYNMDDTQYIIGISPNGYVVSSNVTLNKYDAINSTFSYTSVNSIYGIGFPIHVLPGQTYYVSYDTANSTNISMGYGCYTSDGRYKTYNTVGSSTYMAFTVPQSCTYVIVVFYSTTINTISTVTKPCINLSWSGYRNGEYEAYKKNTYALDSDLTLRGIPKLDASNQLYWDGDEYASDGAVTRKYVQKTLDGTENWSLTTYNRALLGLSDAFIDSTRYPYGMPFMASNTIIFDYATDAYCGLINLSKSLVIYMPESITSIDKWKAQLQANPITIVYEVASTTEEADSYTNPQIVDDFGTEEFVDAAVEAGDRDVSIPVGHESQYMLNLRDKLQHLPDLAPSNGTYALVQNNSQLALTPLITPTELPAAPTTNGTYRLQCVVSNGTPTYSWVSA